MLTLLAGLLPTIIGVFTSGIPHVVKYLEKGQEYKHEMELLKLRMEAASQGLDQQIFLEDLKASIEDGKSVRDHDLAVPSNRYMDALRAGVRPLVTYTFFLAFVGVKIALGVVMYQEGLPGKEILSVIWDGYSNTIFGGIMGFYFGSRAFMHLNGQINPRRK